MKSGNLNFLEPSGLLQACNGTALSFTFWPRLNGLVLLSPSKAPLVPGFLESRVARSAIIPEFYGHAGYNILVVTISSPRTGNYKGPNRNILEGERPRLVSEHKVHRDPLHVQIFLYNLFVHCMWEAQPACIYESAEHQSSLAIFRNLFSILLSAV